MLHASFNLVVFVFSLQPERMKALISQIVFPIIDISQAFVK